MERPLLSYSCLVALVTTQLEPMCQQSTADRITAHITADTAHTPEPSSLSADTTIIITTVGTTSMDMVLVLAILEVTFTADK